MADVGTDDRLPIRRIWGRTRAHSVSAIVLPHVFRHIMSRYAHSVITQNVIFNENCQCSMFASVGHKISPNKSGKIEKSSFNLRCTYYRHIHGQVDQYLPEQWRSKVGQEFGKETLFAVAFVCVCVCVRLSPVTDSSNINFIVSLA